MNERLQSFNRKTRQSNLESKSRFDQMAALVADALAMPIEAGFDEQGIAFTRQGEGLDTTYHLTDKSGEVTGKFYLHNSILEVITVDRDAKPAEIDMRCVNADYFATKVTEVAKLRLKILLAASSPNATEEDVLKSIKGDPSCERIRVIKVDEPESE